MIGSSFVTQLKIIFFIWLCFTFFYRLFRAFLCVLTRWIFPYSSYKWSLFNLATVVFIQCSKIEVRLVTEQTLLTMRWKEGDFQKRNDYMFLSSSSRRCTFVFTLDHALTSSWAFQFQLILLVDDLFWAFVVFFSCFIFLSFFNSFLLFCSFCFLLSIFNTLNIHNCWL
jgi:hypothetical protein